MPSRISRLSRERDLAGADALGLQLVQRDAVLEQHHQQERVDRVAQEVRAPLLVLAHPQDAVADVAVHADDVGVGVVHVVVRVPPLVARAGGVPLEAAAGDRRVAHPVVLAVHDVVADLHVVQDLRQRQHRGAREPGRRQDAANSRPRPPTSRARWALMTRRMYVASRSPRSAITRSLMASSSRPNASACSGVRVTVLPPMVFSMVRCCCVTVR